MKLFAKQQFIIILLAVVIVVGFVFLHFIPLARRTQEIKAAKLLYAQENLKVKDQAQRLPIIISKTEQLKTKIGDLDRKIPVVREFGSLWDQIAAVMKNCGLKEQQIKPETEVKSEDICIIPINIQCSGNLQEIFSFFRSLEGFERVVRIESLSMIGSGREDAIGEIKLTANANFYYRPTGIKTSEEGI